MTRDELAKADFNRLVNQRIMPAALLYASISKIGFRTLRNPLPLLHQP
jgi:hypothetical protein